MKVNECAVFRKENDDTGMLFNPNNADIFALNATSAFIWEQIAAGKDRDGILAAMDDAFADLPATAAADLDRFIAQLKDKGFIE